MQSLGEGGGKGEGDGVKKEMEMRLRRVGGGRQWDNKYLRVQKA